MTEATFTTGDTVTPVEDSGPLGILDPDNQYRFLPEVWASHGDVGEVIWADGLPEGWVLVRFDAGLCPVHPRMVERVQA